MIGKQSNEANSGGEDVHILRFKVQVGHESLLVRGLDRSEAIREARRRLCMELPRMWDVIQGLEDERFGVELIGEAEEVPSRERDS